MDLFGSDYSSLKEKHKKLLQQSTWFHGTTKASIKSLMTTGPKVNFNLGNELDFGAGFYLAPDLGMATRFTEIMVGYKAELAAQFDLSIDEITPVVMEYEFSHRVPEDYFKDESFKTTCFTSYSEDFAYFILKNRLSPDEKIHKYDLVYGVMSDSNPNILVPQVRHGNITEEEFVQQIVTKTTSTRQLSVHNQLICDKLVLKAIHYPTEGVVKHVENIGHGQQ